MPVSVVKKGNEYVVIEPNGKILGTHSTPFAAEQQRRAIEADKQEREGAIHEKRRR